LPWSLGQPLARNDHFHDLRGAVADLEALEAHAIAQPLLVWQIK
jgi:hypothetical protein